MGLVLKHFLGLIRLLLAGKGHTLLCSFWETLPKLKNGSSTACSWGCRAGSARSRAETLC